MPYYVLTTSGSNIQLSDRTRLSKSGPELKCSATGVTDIPVGSSWGSLLRLFLPIYLIRLLCCLFTKARARWYSSQSSSIGRVLAPQRDIFYCVEPYRTESSREASLDDPWQNSLRPKIISLSQKFPVFPDILSKTFSSRASLCLGTTGTSVRPEAGY